MSTLPSVRRLRPQTPGRGFPVCSTSSDGELLKRHEQAYPTGIVGEPTVKVSLSAGPHRAVATAWLAGRAAAVGFQLDFDPGGDEAVVIEFKQP